MKEQFKIFKITPAEVKKIESEPNEPHIHDFEELLIGEHGKIEHFIDFRVLICNSPFVSFVTKGKVHKIKPTIYKEKCSIWGIRFQSDFISETMFHLYTYYHEHASIEMSDDENFRQILTLCEIMNKEMDNPKPSLDIVRGLLKALFKMIEVNLQRSSGLEKPLQKIQNTTFENFLKILEENFRRPESVDFYSEKLFMSSRNLNIVTQKVLNKSVTEIIEMRKLMEAKNLLIYTDKTISEIAFELGYNEKAYFSNVFKKKTNQTPSEFRNELRKIIS